MYLPKPISFEWDKGNINKNLVKHKITNEETEEIFFDKNKTQLKDILHSTKNEPRFLIIGKTKKEKILFVVYTIRNSKIRIISARNLNKKEFYLYEKTN